MVIDISALQELVERGQDWVMVAPDGTTEDPVLPSAAGPANLVVSEVTDAVKLVGQDGLVECSVDRERLWALRVLLVNREVLVRLEPEVVDAVTFLEIVSDAGFRWQVLIRD